MCHVSAVKFGRTSRPNSSIASCISATELATWAKRIASWRRSSEVYAYFNNDWRGYAPANALVLRGRLS